MSAAPTSRTRVVAGAVAYRREWRDTLGRPLVGTVTFTGQARHETPDGFVLGAAPVTVELTDGALNVALPADTYTVQARLRTAEGASVRDTYSLTLP